MIIDQDSIDTTPVLVQRAAGLPANDAGWSEVNRTHAISLRIGAGNDFGSAALIMHWGQIADPNDPGFSQIAPVPPLTVDDCVRLRLTTIAENGQIAWGATLWHGVVESIDWSDPNRATVKVIDLAVLLARTYTSRGWELNHNSALIVEPGYLPAFNAIDGADRALAPEADGYYVHDRRGTGIPWTAHQIADLLLRRGMQSDLPGAPAGVNPIRWRLDPASGGDYTPETLDLHGASIAECMDRLFSAKRGLTWRVTVSNGYAQVLAIDLDAAGSALDTEADLGWTSPTVQERRDGYDYVLVSGARPMVGITLWWKRGEAGGSIEPDGWDPDTADAALDAALLEDVAGKPYDRPEWRRFKLRSAWDGSQYDGTPGGSSTVGLRNILVDPNTYAPPDGDRYWLAPIPPPAALTIERAGPAGQGFTTDAVGPRQSPIVIAGAADRWEDLSQDCRPTPVGGKLLGERNDNGTSVLVLGESAADADRLRAAVSTDGSVLITIGVREWAPLQCAWAAPSDAWSVLSPRVYHLRRPNIEQWLCLAGCVTGITSGGGLDTVASQLDIRDDVPTLQQIRDQLAVRFGRAITAATITRQGGILTTWSPGQMISDLTLVDGRTYHLDMPLAEIAYDFERWTTTLRWAPLIKETPSA
ncbi:MAG: hypothetical protein RL375_3126 [Pseudomonadota bacterium]